METNCNTLTETPVKKLEALRNRATLYELAISHGDRRLLVCYTAKTGPNAIKRIIYDRAARIVALTGVDSIEWTRDGGKMGVWTIALTHRTQRDAIMHGELPFLAEGVTA